MAQDNQTLLINTLYQEGILDSRRLQEIQNAIGKTKKSVEETLLEGNFANSEQIARAKSKMYNIPYVNLVEAGIDKRVLHLIPKHVAQNFQMAAFTKDEKHLSIGMVDPHNYQAVQSAEFLAKEYDVSAEFFVISPESFQYATKQYEEMKEEVGEILGAGTLAEKFKVSPEQQIGEYGKDVEKIVRSAPVSKIVSVIIRHAVDGRASDIHIEPAAKETRVRYRVDGVLRTTLVLPLYIHAAVISRVKVLANLKLDETRKPQDGRMRLVFDEKVVDFRVSTLPLIDNEKVVIRILDSSNSLTTLKDLGFRPSQVHMIEENLKKPHGLFLVTGPTGSGKTTTLYAALNFLNKEGTNIVTLEDPIEYYLSGVNQSQINPEVGFTFASGLRSILRQDPNVIMVGEIRDNETAELVVHASLTGHVVLSTLHTSDAFGAIPRLIDMKIEPFLLSSTMNVIIAQRLVRRICQSCKERAELSKELLLGIEKKIESISKERYQELKIDIKKPFFFYRGRGCKECNQMGYFGRIVIAESLDITDTMKKIIVSGYDMDEVRKEFQDQGDLTLEQDGYVKALHGLTTIEEIFRVIEQ